MLRQRLKYAGSPGKFGIQRRARDFGVFRTFSETVVFLPRQYNHQRFGPNRAPIQGRAALLKRTGFGA